LTVSGVTEYAPLLVGLITTAESAAILKVTPARIRQLIKHGRLQSEKRGRDHLLNRDDVQRFNSEGRLPHGRPRKIENKKILRLR
jgi:excisionase family DNA binding protein